MRQQEEKEKEEGRQEEMSNFIKSVIGTSLSGLMKGHSGTTHNKHHAKFPDKKRKRKLARKSKQRNRR